ncbi:glycosyltransferase [Sphingomonas sp. ID0503]|uniref:glycosyltransferase n=1 Tax=Sphingomonas sp. ID0503 TaxID=3399691 RepID=UPI003AFB5DF3
MSDSFTFPAQSEAGTGDLLEDALAPGFPDPAIGGLDAASARRQASDLLRAAHGDGSFAASLPRALELAAGFPEEEHVQRIVAHLLEGKGDIRAAQRAWRGVSARFPRSVEAATQAFRLTAKALGREAAEAQYRRRFGDAEAITDPERLLMAALALEVLGRHEEAEAACRRAVALRPDHGETRLRLIRLLEERGLIAEAVKAASGTEGDAEVHAQRERLRAELDRLQKSFPRLAFTGAPVWRTVLDDLLARTVAARIAHPPRIANGQLGSVVMIGGTLGGGGAERQLVASALALDRAAKEGRMIGDRAFTGPVSVLCRKLDPRRGQDFFMPALTAQGIQVTGYLAAPRYGGKPSLSVVAGERAAIRELPERVREGVEHLTDLLRYLAPDVVHIWQDGMILAAGLAALLAKVPRIVLNVRTLPPSDRADRFKEEQIPIYRALLASPGVTLTANSALAARRYEQWLGLPERTGWVVPNGVNPLPIAPSPDDEERWRLFDERTSGGFTVGGVMRFDANKRPIDWLAIADRLAARLPDARFILVGDGELRGAAQEFAARRGIADRVLFTGRSAAVGYWLSRMDAFMLTSRFEGTPNVLIEAQLAGLPVITTPAGAAAETIIPGVTGHVLDGGETIDPEEAAARLAAFAAMPVTDRAHISALARERAVQHYSVETMLRHTLEAFAAPLDAPMIAFP